MEDQGGRKRKGWVAVLLTVGIVLDLLLVVYVLYLVWGDNFDLTSLTNPPSTPTQIPVELWDAYEQARAAAQAEATDAQLVSASTQWQAVSEEALLDGANNWSFVFYSPTNEHSLDVVVDAGRAQVVNQTQVWTTPRSLTEGAWQTGPKEALLVFLAYDGRAFLTEHPQAMVDLHLASNDDGKSVWTIVALDPEDRSLSSLLIDAETRQVLSH